MKAVFVAAVCSILLAGCTNPRPVQSFPLNAVAQQNSVVSFELTIRGSLIGKSTARAVMASGEVLEGAFTIIPQGGSGFGQIYGQAYGTATGNQGAFAQMSGTTSATSFNFWHSSSSPGVATLSGNRGTVLDCEVMIDGDFSGTGACRSTQGALYRVHF